jgi:biotin transport system substrate-specific component
MFGDPTRSLLVARTATFVALIAIGGLISLPVPPVPVTLQTLFVLLAGAVMKRSAAYPVLLYLLLGCLGLPIFHNGLAGIGVLLGPTGGYLAGFVPAAVIAGLAYETGSRGVRIAGLFAAGLLILASGTLWLSYSADLALPAAFAAGFLPFIIGDSLKAVAAYAIERRLP